ncbi:Blue-light-activated protein [Jannaschia rubra]|uniref:histidine kinase n=1 Tax=Jannaschia rubra TaxID=282197 RepID=A0A0M6XSC3_9RHOB|nr:Blue-light-activated protein [Jannaschia rubra]SFG26848.1 two-component system, cell cycle sensor histidine kinase and response regulator CckA [Jannaschia rubra]
MGETAKLLRHLRNGSSVFLLVALGALAVSFATEAGPSRLLLMTAAGALGSVVILLYLATGIMGRMARQRLRIVMDFLEHDNAPGFCTDEDGAIFAQNRSAVERFGAHDGSTVTRALESLFANPDAVVHRLRSAAQGRSTAREDVVTRRGHVRVAVHRVPGGFLWRLEDLVERPPRGADGIGLPMLTFGPSGTILYMNEVLRTGVGRRVKRIRDLFEDVPLENGGLNRLLAKSGTTDVRVVLSEPVNGRQEVFVLPAGRAAEGQVALDALPVALLRLDAEGRVSFANRLARDLLPATANGDERRLAAMVEGLGRSVREWVSEAAAGRGLYRAEVVRVTGAEVETYLQITLGRPMNDGEGGLLAVLNDATELKTLEAQFVQSQKMQAIGQLAGGVAHDFNNLLTAISGHCDLLMLRHGEGDDDYADLTQITQNANRAAALVGQLLAFSRKQTLEMRPIDLRDTLGDLAHLLNRLVGERVTLRLQHDPALLPIRGDRRQLEQVLMNLVVNARDAMQDGGEILIETECRYLATSMNRDRVSVPAGQYVVVTVSDQGRGISPDNLTRIFEPFFTTKRPGEGTGLGLSMAYGIIKQSGGYIFADSTSGQGTCFSLYFPALTDQSEIEGAVEPAQPGCAGVAPALMLPDLLPPAPPAAEVIDEESQKDENGKSPMVDPEVPAEGEGADDILRSLLAQTDDADGDAEEVADSSAFDEEVLATETAGDEAIVLRQTASVAGDSRPDNDDHGTSLTSTSRPVVLLVEDEAPVRAFACRALRLRGYDVVEAENAESALEQLSDADLSVDLFVTDVMMPGLDGPTWVREAMKTRPDVRTIFISGYTQDALSETSVPVPNAIFLPKPFSLSDLTRTVERALG